MNKLGILAIVLIVTSWITIAVIYQVASNTTHTINDIEIVWGQTKPIRTESSRSGERNMTMNE